MWRWEIRPDGAGLSNHRDGCRPSSAQLHPPIPRTVTAASAGSWATPWRGGRQRGPRPVVDLSWIGAWTEQSDGIQADDEHGRLAAPGRSGRTGKSFRTGPDRFRHLVLAGRSGPGALHVEPVRARHSGHRVHALVGARRLKPESARLLEEARQRGEVDRGEASRITGLPERTARRLSNQLCAQVYWLQRHQRGRCLYARQTGRSDC